MTTPNAQPDPFVPMTPETLFEETAAFLRGLNYNVTGGAEGLHFGREYVVTVTGAACIFGRYDGKPLRKDPGTLPLAAAHPEILALWTVGSAALQEEPPAPAGPELWTVAKWDSQQVIVSDPKREPRIIGRFGDARDALLAAETPAMRGILQDVAALNGYPLTGDLLARIDATLAASNTSDTPKL